MIRRLIKIPGFDCVYNSCGKNGCVNGFDHGHGICGEQWLYIVVADDLKSGLSLTIITDILPDTVPEDHRRRISDINRRLGADVSFHLARSIDEKHDHASCWLFDGPCEVTGSSGLLADDLMKFGSFEEAEPQPEEFWAALEAQYHRWKE